MITLFSSIAYSYDLGATVRIDFGVQDAFNLGD